MKALKNIVIRFFKSGEIDTSIEYMILSIQLPGEVYYSLRGNYYAFQELFKDFDEYKSWLKNTYGDKLPIKIREIL